MSVGIIAWTVLIFAFAAGFAYARFLKKRLREEGLEALGEISRIDESYDSDTGAVTFTWWARYTDLDGVAREGIIHNPRDLPVGMGIKLKYHPKKPDYLELVEVIGEMPGPHL